jgi:small subunit ribosomal protein S4e
MHLKRLSAPRTVHIPRKGFKFLPRALPGKHPLDSAIPLAVVLRDYLKLTTTYLESKKVIRMGSVLVDGVSVREPRAPIGLADVIHIPRIQKYYRVLPRYKVGLALMEIGEEEAKIKPAQVKRKQHTRGGYIQLTLHDGRNLQFPSSNSEMLRVKVGDTMFIELPSQNVKGVVPRAEGAYCLITSGSQMGAHGVLVRMDRERVYPAKRHAELQTSLGTVTTILGYFMPVGDNKPWIALF